MTDKWQDYHSAELPENKILTLLISVEPEIEFICVLLL